MEKEKIIKWAIIGIVALLIVIIIAKNCNSIIDAVRNRNLNKELNKTIDSANLSYTDDQYDVFAQKLYNALKGWGTDEETVQSVFAQMNTRDDVLKLISTFGIKDGETLSEWLSGDLSQSDMDKYVNNVLQVKSINYSF